MEFDWNVGVFLKSFMTEGLIIKETKEINWIVYKI